VANRGSKPKPPENPFFTLAARMGHMASLHLAIQTTNSGSGEPDSH